MKKWLVFLLMVGLIAVSLIGCGSKEQAANAPASTETKEKQSSSGSDLSSIMQAASEVKGMSFDTVSTISSQEGTMTTNSKFYMNDGSVRIETETQGTKMILITKNSGEMYMYNPTDKTAMKMTSSKQSTELPNEWVKENGDVSGYKITGEEKVDGFNCVVVVPSNDENTKMWIRKDIGMPVKIEAKTDDGSMVTEYKNYKIGAQDVSLFELPEGTQLTTMPDLSNMPNMPDMSDIPQ